MVSQEDTNLPLSPHRNSIKQPVRKKRPGKRTFLNSMLLVGLVVAGGLFAWAEYQRRNAESELLATRQQLERVDGLTQSDGAEIAQKILHKVRTHIVVPHQPEPTVATIVDVDQLRQTNDFYNKAQNGHYLIVTDNRAILYDEELDVIIDVVPVVFDEGEEQASGLAPASEPGTEAGEED